MSAHVSGPLVIVQVWSGQASSSQKRSFSNKNESFKNDDSVKNVEEKNEKKMKCLLKQIFLAAKENFNSISV